MEIDFTIDPAVYQKMELFCKANGLTVEEFLNQKVRESLDLAMYGDLNDKVKKQEPVIVEPEIVQPVEVKAEDITPKPINSELEGNPIHKTTRREIKSK